MQEKDFIFSPSYYQVLKLPKNATRSEIKSAFRRLIVEFHPDKHLDKEYAHQESVKLNDANLVLFKRPDLKAKYDIGLKNFEDEMNFLKNQRENEKREQEKRRREKEEEARRRKRNSNRPNQEDDLILFFLDALLEFMKELRKMDRNR